MIEARVKERLRAIGLADLVVVLFGVLLGLLAAWKSRTVIDYSALLGALMAWACPTFWFGMILLFGVAANSACPSAATW